MFIRKIWDHIIKVKKIFVPRKKKVYILSKEERGEIYKFISEQLRKEYIISQIRYSLVVILRLNSVSGVQYKDMMIDR